MNIRQQLRQWNKGKWESKNRAMYEEFHENRWPWYNDQLDPDIEEYLVAHGIGPLDVLDLGTCSGSQAIELAKRGHRVVGTDISGTALVQAKAAASREDGIEVQFLLDDITASALRENQFDLILDRGCYHSVCCFQHLDYVAGVKRVLKPRGILLLKTMSSEEKRFVTFDTFENKSIQMPLHFTREVLEESLSPHFDVQEIRDSYFFSAVVDPPARARFAILRNTK
jgi:SAM-dependent methyltransferase